jgi:putative transposase
LEPAEGYISSILLGLVPGFGAFSVSQSQVEDVRSYIRNQREHHRVKSFQEVLRALLNSYEIEFDERYVWD